MERSGFLVVVHWPRGKIKNWQSGWWSEISSCGGKTPWPAHSTWLTLR